MSIIALCGFRGHGRKTFFKNSLKKLNYDVAHKTVTFFCPTKPLLTMKLFQRPKLINFSSDVKIKHELCDRYNMNFERLEEMLDNRINDCSITYRDILEATMNQRLRRDPIYCLSGIINLNITPDTTVMITDIRSCFELEYLKRFSDSRKYEFMTARIFRDDVFLPGDHELNLVKTDYFIGNTHNSLQKFRTASGNHDPLMTDFPNILPIVKND